MDLLSWSFFALGIPAVMFAGISKGGFGSGAAFASGSILAIVLEPGQALGIMLPLLMLIDAASLKPYWKKWSWQDARLMILGGVPGVGLGVLFFTLTDDDAVRLLIGVICIAFVAHQLAQSRGLLRPPAARLPPKAGLAAGVGLGFTSFVSHAGGPVAAVYLLSQGLGKTTYQATTVVVFWAINLLKFGIYAWLGMFTLQTLTVDLLLAPFAILGTWIGVRLHAHVPEGPFFALTYVALCLTGAKLIWDALG